MEEVRSMESVLETVREACTSADVPFKEVKKLLGNLVGTDTIISSYISIGPFPEREDVLLDIFVLSPSCLYNLDIRTTEHLCHRFILAHLSIIEEASGEDNMVYYLYAGTHELMITDRTTRRDDIEKFCSEIKEAAVAIQQSNR